jgi:acetyl-CoA C-acetyltransferase
MGKRVGIVAVTQTKYEEAQPHLSLHDLAYEPVKAILNETGLKFTEDGNGIDATVGCCNDYWTGWAISSKLYLDQAGGHLRAEEKVDGDGASAVFYAALSILSGHYDTILVLSFNKESQVNGRLVEYQGLEPNYSRLLGMDFVSAAALQARSYMNRYGITEEQASLVVIKNRKNAKSNPFVQFGRDLTVKDVLASPMLSSPLRELDVKPCCDGACALILTTEEKTKRWTSKPIWLEGMGSCYDSHYLGDRDLSEPRSLVAAAQQAYKMSGIIDPRREVDVVEMSEHTSYQELIWSEGLGLCEKGGGGKLIESGDSQLKGQIPINPSGGLLAGVPVVVGGMNRVIEAVIQLRGEAGGQQVDGAKAALAHGTHGVCGQFHQVFILRRGF